MNEMISILACEESGQGMVEYGLIIALVAVACIGALLGFRTAREEIFNSIADTIASVANGL